jgi:hypothetical protein
MTYLQEFLRETPKPRPSWVQEAYYPNYPSFEAREEAREELDVIMVSQSTQEALEAYHKSSDVFGLEEFRGFLQDIVGLDRVQALVYPQETGLNRFFCKHFGNRTTVQRVLSQVRKFTN